MSRSPYPCSVSSLTLALGAMAALCLGACQAYRPEPRSTPERAVTAQAPPAGPLAFAQALRLLVERNPELAALRARAGGGVNLRPNDASLDAELEVEDGRASQLTVGTDLLALFGLGARPAQQALARAVRSEALARHHERARELAAELATAYAEDRSRPSTARTAPSRPQRWCSRSAAAPRTGRCTACSPSTWRARSSATEAA